VGKAAYWPRCVVAGDCDAQGLAQVVYLLAAHGLDLRMLVVEVLLEGIVADC